MFAFIVNLVKLPSCNEAFLDVDGLRQYGLLLNIEYAQAVLHAKLAVVKMRMSCKDGEQSTLASAVAAD